MGERKAKVIKDPVHGYLTVAAHESIVVDHPITQRLRRINQTGLAELVYPEARCSRFVHSLGAMHLASQFLTACIENADEDVALEFFDALRKQSELFKDFLVTPKDMDSLLHIESHAGSGLSAGRVVFRTAKLRAKESDHRALLILVESAVRLAALFHDLGHLPFSHDFEFALRDYIGDCIGQDVDKPDLLRSLRSGLPPHERIGHRLAKVVFRAIVEGADSTPAERAAFKLAVNILDYEERYDEVPSPQVTALGWLHSLVDGEIDVDRADYLLRDGRALGLEFANYDLARLIANLKLARDPDLGFITCIREQGLSSLESFYLTRSRTNQVLVRHHKVAQIGVALRYATTAVFKERLADGFLNAIRALISDELSSQDQKDALKQFAVYDDSLWIQQLQTLDQRRRLGQLQGLGRRHDSMLGASLDLVLWRQSTFRTLWKRRGDLNPRQLEQLKFATDKASHELSRFEEVRRHLLQEHNTLIALHKFRPYAFQGGANRKKSVALLETQEKKLVSAAEMSPLIEALYAAWDNDIHLHAFSLTNSQVTSDDVLDLLAQ